MNSFCWFGASIIQLTLLNMTLPLSTSTALNWHTLRRGDIQFVVSVSWSGEVWYLRVEDNNTCGTRRRRRRRRNMKENMFLSAVFAASFPPSLCVSCSRAVKSGQRGEAGGGTAGASLSSGSSVTVRRPNWPRHEVCFLLISRLTLPLQHSGSHCLLLPCFPTQSLVLLNLSPPWHTPTTHPQHTLSHSTPTTHPQKLRVHNTTFLYFSLFYYLLPVTGCFRWSFK